MKRAVMLLGFVATGSSRPCQSCNTRYKNRYKNTTRSIPDRLSENQVKGYHRAMTELRVVIPDEVAERLALTAAEQGTSAEDIAAQVLTSHTPPTTAKSLPSWIGAIRSGRKDLSERHEEIIKSELGNAS